jgi:hypothetical protein
MEHLPTQLGDQLLGRSAGGFDGFHVLGVHPGSSVRPEAKGPLIVEGQVSLTKVRV